MARLQGIKVGLLRPISLYPYPYEMVNKLADQVRGILVVEMNAGQMVEDVRLGVNGKIPVDFYGRMGGIIPTPEDTLTSLKKLMNKTQPKKSSEKLIKEKV